VTPSFHALYSQSGKVCSVPNPWAGQGVQRQAGVLGADEHVDVVGRAGTAVVAEEAPPMNRWGMPFRSRASAVSARTARKVPSSWSSPVRGST
jgi:hypothetical protein